MRIGVICTPSIEYEIEKDELTLIDPDLRPWLVDLPKKYVINYENGLYTTDDISIAYYLKHTLKTQKHEVKVIYPTDEDAIEQVKNNDINFLLIFDMLEAFHTLPTRKFEKVRDIFALHNVFPAYDYQFFVNHKHVYMDYLRTKGINVLPFLHISRKEFELNPEETVEKVMSFPRGDDDKIIGKPVYGQESIGFKIFTKNATEDNYEHYIDKIFMRFKDVIFQPYIKALDSSAEYRVYYVGERPIFGIKNDYNENKNSYYEIENEPEILEFTNKVMAMLPPLKFKGWDTPRLLTRIDVGCCYGDTKLFVSEIEFVPSLYMTDIPKGMLLDAMLGDQMIHIIQHLRDKTDVFVKAGFRMDVFMIVTTIITLAFFILLVMVWVCKK